LKDRQKLHAILDNHLAAAIGKINYYHSFSSLGKLFADEKFSGRGNKKRSYHCIKKFVRFFSAEKKLTVRLS